MILLLWWVLEVRSGTEGFGSASEVLDPCTAAQYLTAPRLWGRPLVAMVDITLETIMKELSGIKATMYSMHATTALTAADLKALNDDLCSFNMLLDTTDSRVDAFDNRHTVVKTNPNVCSKL
ncbi:hypothetical protein NDU88_003177 [Pleurodeles waltl]|uniref:Prolactin n=1 Tax=Pleurodeles waltl TaxID=8319 RepID=A0AAV7NK00_PLEWA|nr:hypothetical protein NDU88_003177 [Pleurodeles waltl]